MAEFAYSLDGGIGIVKDFALSAGYNATVAKKGELVYVDSATGYPVKVVAASTKCTGALEGVEFTGLVAQGQPYAATNASKTASVTGAANGIGKVRIGREAVYRVPVKSGATLTVANIGTTAGVLVDGNGVQTIDTAAVGKPLTIVDISPDGKTAFVTASTI